MLRGGGGALFFVEVRMDGVCSQTLQLKRVVPGLSGRLRLLQPLNFCDRHFAVPLGHHLRFRKRGANTVSGKVGVDRVDKIFDVWHMLRPSFCYAPVNERGLDTGFNGVGFRMIFGVHMRSVSSVD